MRWLRFILAVLLAALVSVPSRAEDFDMNEYLFGHIGDSYE